MIENKERFCEGLGTLLLMYSRTDVRNIEYRRDETKAEYADITFMNGYKKAVNITCDSCIAIMKDLYNALL